MKNNLSNFKNLLTKNNRNFAIKIPKKIFTSISKIVNQSVEKKFDLSSKLDLRKLSLNDCKKMDFNLRGRYQKNLIKILKPEIQKLTNQIFNDDELSDFRVGPQCKYKKIYSTSDNKKIKYKKYTDLKKYNLPLNKEQLVFSTKPHQDLSNQGFRSSMSLIFYLQLTNHYKDTCLMQNVIFKNKVGLYDFDSTEFYPNEIKKTSSKNMKWYVPNSMIPGKIFVFDSITPHNSNEVSEIPRIAINIKIQPRSLNYIYKIFKLKKRFTKNLKTNFKILEEDLKYCSKYSNSLNFELSVLYLIQKKFDKAFKAFNKFSITKFEKIKIKKIFAGSLFRKSYETITQQDIKNAFRKKLTYSELSCADSIFKTFKI